MRDGISYDREAIRSMLDNRSNLFIFRNLEYDVAGAGRRRNRGKASWDERLDNRPSVG